MNAIALFLALFLFALLPARAGLHPLVTGTSVPPVFLTGTAPGQANPYYFQSPFNEVPVGKTLVLPIAVSGSGPMTYSATSTSSALAPIIKTGYPVMNIHVTYAGVTGSLTTLYSFTGGNDGGNPDAGLVQATNGNFYGTTESGSNGFGTVFQVTTSGSLTTLHAFAGGSDGANPVAPLIQGTGGALYGTTEAGGSGFGTIFQVTTSGSLTTLYTFTGGSDGGNPRGGVFQAADGNFYGTTGSDGANGHGTIFQLTSGGSISTLYSFTGGADGGNPAAGLVQGTGTNLYGTTASGGISSAGTVFQVSTTGSLTTLYSFTGGTDGGTPQAGLIQASDGNLYGTTEADGVGGFGTVFQVTTSGLLTTLHSFAGGTDGGNPFAPLVQGTGGDLYGTTETSGTVGFGTVFQITTSGSLTTLHTFAGGADGGNPFAGLVQGTDGNLYGTTATDGTTGFGTVFKIPPPTNPFSGTMVFALLRDMAPVTCGYIAGFAQAGYYNNTDFFRITNLASAGEAATFIAQGGDPTETGTGSPGFAFNNEQSPSLMFYGQGQLAMANAGTDTTTFLGSNGAQLFITQNPLRSLDFNYTIFGQLLTGFDIMNKVMGVTLEANGSSPVVPVVMDSVTVSEDDTDAILLVNAAGSAPNGATINVTATDPAGNKAVSPIVGGTGSTTGLSLFIATFDDNVNDPPIIEPQPNVFAGLHQKVTIPLKAVDLEYDYLITGAQVVADPSNASLAAAGNIATITPNALDPVGGITAGLYVYEPFNANTSVERTPVTVGLGSGKLTAFPALFTAPTGIGLVSSTATNIGGATPAFGSFIDSNPMVGPGEFTATINWGDGTALATGSNTVSVARSGYLPTTYNISGPDHIYGKTGIYPVNVTVTDTNGGVLEIQNTAVVSAGPIYPFGRELTAAKGLANGVVASFVDHSSGVIPSNYDAVINWGDGSVGKGTIRGGGSTFLVYGKHQYKSGSTYPVDVTVSYNTGVADSSYAWSTARLTGVPTHQPPFAQSHIDGQLGNPGFDADSLDEEVTLFNSGNLASGAISLKFYLSPDASTDPINSAAIPLSVNGNSVYKTVSIPAGSAIAGSVSNIQIPAGAVTRNHYLIMQVITSDPIGSHMDYPRAFADPNPLIE